MAWRCSRLLIAYLPTIYGAFSRREVLGRAARDARREPPSGVQILVRAQQMERFQLLDELWVTWQQWFAEVEETHTSLGVLSFFRSPSPHRSWVTAARRGARRRVAAPVRASTCPFDPEAGLCVRGRVLRAARDCCVLRHPLRRRPAPTKIPISISKDEFLEACDQLVEAGMPVRDDRDAGVERVPRLAGELRQRARRPRRVRDGAVRAVVVGPLARVPAAAPAPRAPARPTDRRAAELLVEQPGLGARRASGRGG